MQTTVCIGFIICTTNMTLSLTDEKKTKIKDFSKDIVL